VVQNERMCILPAPKVPNTDLASPVEGRGDWIPVYMKILDNCKAFTVFYTQASMRLLGLDAGRAWSNKQSQSGLGLFEFDEGIPVLIISGNLTSSENDCTARGCYSTVQTPKTEFAITFCAWSHHLNSWYRSIYIQRYIWWYKTFVVQYAVDDLS